MRQQLQAGGPGAAELLRCIGLFPRRHHAVLRGGRHGFSWAARILPYLEYGSLYDKINWNLSGWAGSASENGALIHQLSMPVFSCPASPCTPFSNYWNGAYRVPIGSMVGIAGAIGYANSSGTLVSDGRMDSASTETAKRRARNGVLYPYSFVGTEDIRDGTTNVLCVGETSDWWHQPGRPAVRYDCRGMFPHSFLMGSSSDRISNPARHPLHPRRFGMRATAADGAGLGAGSRRRTARHRRDRLLPAGQRSQRQRED